MHLVLFGESGAACWLCPDISHAKLCKKSASVLANARPSKASCTYLLNQFPALNQPVHFLSNQKTRGSGVFWKTHLTNYPYPPNSFWQIGNGLYVPCPELCFIQACTTATDYQALKIGAALCGSFFIQPQAPSGLASRKPATTPDHIRQYLKRVPNLDGAKKARRLLPHIPRNAASPPEVFLFLVLTLPGCWGGCNLPPPLLNQRIKPGRKARTIAQRETLVPDLYWPHAKTTLEFDSDTIHLNGAQATRDSTKRLALESSGHRTFTVTTNQLASRNRMSHIARQLARTLGCPSRTRARNFSRKQAELFSEGWSLDWLFDPSWLSPQLLEESAGAERQECLPLMASGASAASVASGASGVSGVSGSPQQIASQR